MFDKDFDPYDKLIALQEIVTQLAENQQNMAEQLTQNAWMIEEITNGCERIAQTITNLHNRLIKLENQNEKD